MYCQRVTLLDKVTFTIPRPTMIFKHIIAFVYSVKAVFALTRCNLKIGTRIRQIKTSVIKN